MHRGGFLASGKHRRLPVAGTCRAFTDQRLRCLSLQSARIQEPGRAGKIGGQVRADIRYCEIRVPEHNNLTALDAAVALADWSPFPEFMIYEQEGTWLYAGGSAGRITVTAREVRAEWPGSVSVQAWAGSPFP